MSFPESNQDGHPPEPSEPEDIRFRTALEIVKTVIFAYRMHQSDFSFRIAAEQVVAILNRRENEEADNQD